MKYNKSLLKHIAMHLGLMAIVAGSLVCLFFQYLLPVLTRHGQFVTVPSLRGVVLEEADMLLAQRGLCFAVTDEVAYAPDYAPMTVLRQHPKAGARVKEGRKIYLTLNTAAPPQVKMPVLVDSSVRNAHERLQSQGLLLGTIRYVPDIAEKSVLEQWHQGQQIPPGTLVPKGTKIDLVVGAGLGNKQVEVPQVTGTRLATAQGLFLDTGIKFGNIAHEAVADQVPGTVLRQVPAAGTKVKLGETVDVWLVAPQEVAPVLPNVPRLSN